MPMPDPVAAACLERSSRSNEGSTAGFDDLKQRHIYSLSVHLRKKWSPLLGDLENQGGMELYQRMCICSLFLKFV
ncbi:hypothetical protein BS78_02G098800 [Paspalum vaginatum]|nr:hypothetical protein BS78_02G098800 [Paspalum vaginatum]